MNALHPARPEDHDAIDAFLAPLTATSMFLRSNIRENGVTGGPAPFATRIWIDRDGRAITGVIGLTTRGMVLLQMPAAGASGMARAAETLAGKAATGLSAEAGQARAFRAAAGLEGGAALDKDEWLYGLDLADLVVPAGGDTVRRPGAADVPLLERWRAAYHVEALATPPADAAVLARRDIAAMLAAGTCRLLERDGVPVGMTALNAEVLGWVQVGSVFTPPELRGSGIARRVVAGHLAELRDAGVQRAVLFASDPAARRVYETIGFRRQGSYALVLFPEPRPIGAGA